MLLWAADFAQVRHPTADGIEAPLAIAEFVVVKMEYFESFDFVSALPQQVLMQPLDFAATVAKPLVLFLGLEHFVSGPTVTQPATHPSWLNSPLSASHAVNTVAPQLSLDAALQHKPNHNKPLPVKPLFD